MEDQPTQKATQPINLPTRHRSISEQDQCDIICILHPTSALSCKMIENIAITTSQHILQHSGFSRHSEEDLLEPTSLSPIDPGPSLHTANVPPHNEPDPKEPFKSTTQRPPVPNHGFDIALRMSSQVKDPSQGFTFGRLSIKSDIVLKAGPPEENILSGIHFRIYFNKDNILMLQDMSTNGTYVDDKLLQCKKAQNGQSFSRFIHQGSVIEILNPPKEPIRFVVSVPERGDNADKYEENFREYMAFVQQVTRQKAAMKQAKLAGNALEVPEIPAIPLRHQLLPRNRDTRGRTNASLAPGSERNTCGMLWNGGDKYAVVAKIGHGTFANVYKLVTRREGNVVAAKEVEKRRFVKNGAAGQTVDNELKIMKTVHHPHIVEFVDFHETKEHLYIMMEYIAGGDLRGYMNPSEQDFTGLTNPGLMPESTGKSVTRQLCHALDYLHKSGITHRDLKPDNILIAKEEPLTVKLSDFGLSKVVKEEDSVLKTFCGTLLYCAPEVYPDYQRIKMGHPRKRRRTNDPIPKTAPYSSAVDVWSLGAVIYHLLSTKAPWCFAGDSASNVMCETIMRVPMPLEPLHSVGISNAGIDFLQRMLDTEPTTRTTMEKCLNHAWLDVKDIFDMKLQPEAMPSELESIQEDDEENAEMRDDDGHGLEDSKLSQLSLHDSNRKALSSGSDEEDSLQVEEIRHGRQLKRSRLEPEIHSSSDADYDEFAMPDLDEHIHPHNQGQNRLFGEIGASALRSSGVLDQDAHRALEVPLGGTQTDPSRVPYDYHQSPVTTSDITQHRLEHSQPAHPQPPSTSAASSLLGAEAQIGKMNMASPESASSLPIDHASPWSNSQLSDSIGPGSKAVSQTEAPKTQHSTSQRTNVVETHRASSRLPSAPNSISKMGKPSTPGRAFPSSTHSTQEILPPFLGALTTVPACEITTTIPLKHRITTWGREPNPAKCNNTWHDNMDARIPRIAFDITFWRAGVEREEATNPSFHWLSLPEREISTVITTRSSGGISVNGVKLVRQDDNGQTLFGFLRTGDVVGVWEKGGKRIAFQVEIGYGVCKERRREGETFVVERDTYFFGRGKGASASASGAAGGSASGTAGGGGGGGGGNNTVIAAMTTTATTATATAATTATAASPPNPGRA